jgi:hypothetical protein
MVSRETGDVMYLESQLDWVLESCRFPHAEASSTEQSRTRI